MKTLQSMKKSRKEKSGKADQKKRSKFMEHLSLVPTKLSNSMPDNPKSLISNFLAGLSQFQRTNRLKLMTLREKSSITSMQRLKKISSRKMKTLTLMQIWKTYSKIA